ncbi:RsmF rRNA methyltransferase first C-terminal domain-containing protein [Tepidibacillus fermentans]|uniref:NOL1/NOP2/sun family putative RNA methylase n=1 Tax=Tepidibacillus fermentans TaxID=1281767 RepID=A0A4R3KIH6_9BACI|nr:RsmF rRNA methyltransferase first C-terminal domain-containing protein [Tepidibacillus fermentans]TCS83169.1 NOL1/NOP2/sun family putative RNA methylase [Tepidibacillus fermentans]
MVQLPQAFLLRMQQLLGESFESFRRSYEQSQTHGLRVNTLKIDIPSFLQSVPFSLESIPWTKEGFYYKEEDRPGKHPFHSAGLYYIQEPSAMAVTEVLDPQPGEKILDLSAAPGGKSTHIATKLNHQGLLVANEIHPTRVKALVENLERFGAKNSVVTNESPEQLAKVFPEYFDRILVDAPCSGEGMFRKNPETIGEWSEEHVQFCAIRQKGILDEAQKMLKPGGILVYSTCTFAPEENEGTVAAFLERYHQFEIETIPNELANLFAQGHPEWINEKQNPSITSTVRLWPHLLKGEGHFIAKLRKKESTITAKMKPMQYKANSEALKFYQSFVRENLIQSLNGTFHTFGDHLYLVPDNLPDLKGIKIARIGWHLGEIKKNRFEPGHALAMGLTMKEVKQSLDLDFENTEKYLKGESFFVDPPLKGWILVTTHGFPLGWGKIANGQLKNHYPKGLRWKK